MTLRNEDLEDELKKRKIKKKEEVREKEYDVAEKTYEKDNI